MMNEDLIFEEQIVALRKESVDRNASQNRERSIQCLSLSARRAWIEMSVVRFATSLLVVALRKESVDRNTILRCLKRETLLRRSPQGERG